MFDSIIGMRLCVQNGSRLSQGSRKKSDFFSGRTTKRGTGKGRTTKEKELFLKLEKKICKKG